jgi:aspartyl aminopeptidase
LINVSKEEIIAQQSSINIIALFDNEEIGSLTYQGANGSFFYNHLNRIYHQTSTNPSTDGFLAMCNRSFVVSADLAHSYNPNFPQKFQNEHQNKTNEGVVIKINANGRYSSDPESGALIKEIAKKCNVPMQEFIVRQDSPCGTTIGPIISSRLGIRSVDVGIPQFAMHSIREMLGVCDLYYYRMLFEEFFKSYEECVGKLLEK